LAELEDILQQSSAKSLTKPECEGGLSSNEQSTTQPGVSPLVQKSVAQLIQTVRDVLVNGSASLPGSAAKTQSSGHISEDNSSRTPPAMQSKDALMSQMPVTKVVSYGGSGAVGHIKSDVETQTDDTSYSGLLIERTSPAGEEEVGVVARLEISHLRDTRMSLVNQRKDVSDKMKQVAYL